jgi:hypothetical protein
LTENNFSSWRRKKNFKEKFVDLVAVWKERRKEG